MKDVNWLLGGAGAVPLLGSGHADSESCCGETASTSGPRCCNTAQGQPVDGDSSCSASGGCQCHALANNVEPTKITDWSGDIAESQLHVRVEILSTWLPVVSGHSRNVPAEALPPPDRVVLFLHLTI